MAVTAFTKNVSVEEAMAKLREAVESFPAHVHANGEDFPAETTLFDWLESFYEHFERRYLNQ